MSGLFGKKSQGTTDQRLNAIQINQSAYGNAMPLVYGQTRIPLTLGWYGNFTATPHTTSQGGGKGGGGGGSNTTYTYSAALIGMLCEGQIASIATIWADKEQRSLSDLGFTLFTGAGGQATWSYLTTNFPSQAIPYDHTAYVAHASFQLGGSAGLPNLTFEVTGLQSFVTFGIPDAEASDILIDYCTDANHGAGFNFLGALQGAGVTTWESYCIAMGFFFSPAESTQRPAVDFIKELMQMTNSAAVWSAGVLNVIPYADASVTGNSRTYTPDLTPLFSFTDDDYCPAEGDEPVTVRRKPASETFNRVRVEFLDRANQYNTAIAEATDAQDIALNGERTMSTVNLHAITTAPLARLVAQLILQRQLYIRNEYTFRVRADYSLVEPMDLVSITDSVLGISNQLVRLIEVQDDEEDFLTLIAEEMLVGTANAPRYNWQAAQGYAANYFATPGSVTTPLIFMMPPLLVDVNGGYELAIAVASTSGLWGGCDVFMSLDNAVYMYVGTINGPARYGTLTATMASGSDPDTANALQVLLANTNLTLTAGSAADVDNLRTLIYVDGEIMAYEYCTLTAPGAYTFTSNGNPTTGTKYMRRGKYGSTIASHASGSSFARLDNAIFRLPIDPGMIGQTVYFKFPSFNLYGSNQESLASVTAYSKVLSSANIGQNVPGNATLIARGNCAIVGDKIFKSGGATAWDSDCYSLEAYSGGCVVKFRAAQTNLSFLIGLNSDPITDQNYTSIDFNWYASSDGIAYIYESGGSAVGSYGAYTTSTVFSITYDGLSIRYYMDGVLKREVSAPGKVLFLDSSFLSPGAIATDVYFGALNSSPTQPLIARGNCVVVGNSIQKVGGVNVWDSDCYSRDTYSAGCQLRFRAGQTNLDAMLGLNSDPLTDSNYTSLDHTWRTAADGTVNIYESGTFIAAFGAYTTDTVLSITYDGITVRYYMNGVLKREVQAPGRAFFFDSSFAGPGFIALDVDFSPLNSAPSSGLIARGNCVVVGNSIQKVGGSAAWDSDCYSAETFPGGCALSFKITAPGTTDYMLGLNSDPTTDQSYSSLDYSLRVANSNLYAYESGTGTGVLASCAEGDIASIKYDGQWVRYYKNASLLREIFDPGKTFFLDSSFNSPGAIALDVTFGPLTIATPSPFIARGNCKVSGSNIIKQGGSAAWDSDCYSIVGYPNCHVSWKANSTSTDVGVGLNTDPTTDSNYASIDYWIDCSTSGTWVIYESGTNTSVTGSYTTGTVFAITYDGSTLTYYVDGVSKRTVAVSGLTLFMDSSFYTPGGGINSLRFGPTTNLKVNDTPELAPGSATDILTSSVSSTTITQAMFTPDGFAHNDTIASVTYTPPFDCDVLVTVSCAVQYTTAASGGPPYFIDFRHSIQDATYDISKRQEWFENPAAASVTKYMTITGSRRFAGIAGASVTYSFVAAKYATGDTVTVVNTQMRVEGVKR